jgi:hypothetical protein
VKQAEKKAPTSGEQSLSTPQPASKRAAPTADTPAMLDMVASSKLSKSAAVEANKALLSMRDFFEEVDDEKLLVEEPSTPQPSVASQKRRRTNNNEATLRLKHLELASAYDQCV